MPSLTRLDQVGAALQRSLLEATELFDHMLRLSPSSVTTIRAYAQFAEEVRG